MCIYLDKYNNSVWIYNQWYSCCEDLFLEDMIKKHNKHKVGTKIENQIFVYSVYVVFIYIRRDILP